VGALNAQGIWTYTEDDPSSPRSDLFNLLSDSVTDAVELDRTRLTALEGKTGDTGWQTVPAGWYAAGWSGYTGAGWTGLLYRLRHGHLTLTGAVTKSSATVAGETICTFPSTPTNLRVSTRVKAFANNSVAPVMTPTGALIITATGSVPFDLYAHAPVG
jgi:hypothetical protein